jgi:hypothetical protein
MYMRQINTFVLTGSTLHFHIISQMAGFSKNEAKIRFSQFCEPPSNATIVQCSSRARRIFPLSLVLYNILLFVFSIQVHLFALNDPLLGVLYEDETTCVETIIAPLYISEIKSISTKFGTAVLCIMLPRNQDFH